MSQKLLKPKAKIDKKSWQKRNVARRDARELVAAMHEATSRGTTLEVHNGKPVGDLIAALGHHLTTAMAADKTK